MFEAKHKPLLSRKAFIKRLARNVLLGSCFAALSLYAGMLGYHYTEGLSWMDSYLNASMILSGMGPVDDPKTFLGKLFAGSYALFSGLAFLIIMAVMFAPLFHRFLHKFLLEDETVVKIKQVHEKHNKD